MNIVTSQKTTTAFAIALDAADVSSLLIQALRAKLNVPDGYPGVTASVDLRADGSGSITGTVTVEVETPASSAGAEAVAAPSGEPVAVAPAADVAPAEPPAAPPAAVPVVAAAPSPVGIFAKAA